MKVLKTINNNVVSCMDDNGQELVVMGRGLGFRSKPGDRLTLAMVEKVFRMDTQEQTSQLKDLLSHLPPEFLDLCTQIVSYATQTLARRLNESIFLTLTDHISFAIARFREGFSTHNALTTEVRVFYPGEYAVGTYALELIEHEQHVRLPEDEAANIALHLINAAYDGSMNSTMRTVQVLNPIRKILHGWQGLALDPKSLTYDELIVHLKFMAMQAFSGQRIDWIEPAQTSQVSNFFPNEYACAGAICTYLTEQCGHTVCSAEQAYLAICIRRACK